MKKLLPIFLLIFIFTAVLCLVGCKRSEEDISYILVSQAPNKTTYYAGEKLDMSGCKIVVRTKSGKDYTVDVTNDMVKGFVNTLGNHTLTITYEIGSSSFSTTQPYVVQRALAVSAVVVTNPQKTIYVDGDTVDLKGLVANVTFSDGTTHERTSGAFSATRTKVSKGDTSITVKIDNYTFDIPISVVDKEISGIKVTALPKTTYTEGDIFDSTGLKVNLVYNNGEVSTEITPYYDATPLKESDKTVTLTAYYQDKTFTTQVNVTVQKRVLESITLNIDQKTSFVKTEEIDLSNITASVLCSNGDVLSATAFDLDFYANGNLLTKETRLDVGEYTLDVYYKYSSGSTVKATLKISVTAEPVIIALEVFTPVEITEYYPEEEVRFRGLRLFAVYNNGESEEIVNGSVFAEGVTYTPEFTDEDTQQVTIYYKGLEYSYPITIIND